MKFEAMPIATEKQIIETEKAAYNIWRNYYKDIFPKDQIEYMLKLFHSKEAVRKQIANGYIHMSLLLDGEVIGYMCYYVKNDCLYLPRLYIKPEYRRQGLAKQAVARLEKLLQNPEHELTHIKKIRHNISKKNTFAVNIYEHLGFKKIREVTVDFGNGFTSDDYIMEKTINKVK